MLSPPQPAFAPKQVKQSQRLGDPPLDWWMRRRQPDDAEGGNLTSKGVSRQVEVGHF